MMNKVAKNTMLYMIGSFVYLFSQWLMSILVVRLSGSYEEAGVFGIALSVSNILYMISIFSVRNYQVADINNKFSHGEYLSLRIITCFAALIIMPVYLIFMGYSLYTSLSVVGFMIIKTGEALVDTFQGIYQKSWRLDISCKSLIIRGVLNLAVFSIAERLLKNLVISLFMTAAVSMICAILIDGKPCIKKYDIKIDFKNKNLSNLLLSCLPVFIYGLLSSLVYNAPRIVAQKICGDELFGYYASVATPTVVMIVAINSIFSPCITLMSEQYSKKDKGIYKTILRIQVIILAVSLLAVAGFALFGKIFLSIAFDESILEYFYLLVPAVIATALISTAAYVASIFVVCGHNITIAVLEGLTFIIELILSLFLIKEYQLQGINYTLIISCAAMIITGYLLVLNIIKNHYKSVK